MRYRQLGRRLVYARYLLAAVGLVVSAYLALYTNVLCPSNGLLNCDKVLTSSYSVIFGIPNGYYGIAFFAIVLALAYLRRPGALIVVTAAGIGFVAYLVHAEYLLGAICLYCSVVHLMTVCLFLISLYELGGESRKQGGGSKEPEAQQQELYAV